MIKRAACSSGVFVTTPFNQMRESVFSHVNAQPDDLTDPVITYHLIQQNRELSKNLGKELFSPLVIVGPSGAGKGTLINALQTAFPSKFAFSVSYTTRGIRAQEVDGIHYNFVNKDTFETMKAKDEFLETAAVHGNYYGTAKVGITKIQD